MEARPSVPDDVLAKRMLETHQQRYNDRYWQIFDTLVATRLPEEPRVVDLGCGPGEYLHDLAGRLPGGLLAGYDKAPEMVAQARARTAHHAAVTIHEADLEAGLPDLAPGSVDLLTLNFVFHYFDWPVPLLDWARQVLDPTRGILQVYDWTRTPMKEYLRTVPAGDEAAMKTRLMLFPRHNRYTFEDLTWFLVDQGFQVIFAERLRNEHAVLLATPRSTGKL